MDNNYNKFLKHCPSYESTTSIDEVRARDYSRVDRAGHIYLDYTGGGLYAESQVNNHQQILLENTFGTPPRRIPHHLLPQS